MTVLESLIRHPWRYWCHGLRGAMFVECAGELLTIGIVVRGSGVAYPSPAGGYHSWVGSWADARALHDAIMADQSVAIGSCHDTEDVLHVGKSLLELPEFVDNDRWREVAIEANVTGQTRRVSLTVAADELRNLANAMCFDLAIRMPPELRPGDDREWFKEVPEP